MPARVLAGAMCVQRFDDSLNSAIHITYRISLRSSSMPEPRDPLLKVLTYLLVFSEKPLKYRIVLGAPAGTPPEGGSVPREGTPAEATRTGNVHNGLGVFSELCNDPSAGSPTETLLRLLLPLNDRVWITFRPWVVVADLPGPVRKPH
jgi:hypothetical protein